MTRLVVDLRECTADFRTAARAAGARLASHPISARGPDGEGLAVDIATLGGVRPDRALVVLSGVHGVEGFAPSEAQRGLLARLATGALPDDLAVVLVHPVNPWGMAHCRRQNESNVDLNRNWRRSDTQPERNDAYAELHHLVCPDTPTLPPVDELLGRLAEIVDERGAGWVADGITRGQYHHPDGLHYGGERTEESCTVLERELPRLVGTASKLLVVDLHTGHGRYGEMTYLSTAPVGSEHDAFLRSAFGELESSAAGGVDATSGQIAGGIAALVPDATSCSVTAEVGTTRDLEQLAATYHEQWVFRHGGDHADHRSARRRYLRNFTPDDPAWEAAARAGLRATLDAALLAVLAWP